MKLSIPNIDLLQNHIETIIKTTAISMYWKDKMGVYLGANDEFLKISALNSYDDIVGKTDLDLIWGKQASVMMENDKEIINLDISKVYLENAKTLDNHLVQYHSYKTPLYSSNSKIIGTVGISFPMNNGPKDSLFFMNTNMNEKVKEELIANVCIPGISPRQIQCLYFLIKGFTVKSIAAKLELSPKTVENYIEILKDKLHCNSRMELIAKGLQIKVIRDYL